VQLRTAALSPARAGTAAATITMIAIISPMRFMSSNFRAFIADN
jgi:hypothetical protein